MLFADLRTTHCKSEYVSVTFFGFIDVCLYAKSRTEISNTEEDIITYKEPFKLIGEELFDLKVESQFFHRYTVLTGW